MKTCVICNISKSIEDFYVSIDRNKDRHRNACKECEKRIKKSIYRENVAKSLHKNAKARAKKRGLEFSITVEDITIPSVCPVLGIPIEVGKGKQTHNSPTIDRIDNTKGYTKDNVIVVSWRANYIKNNASVEELLTVAHFYKERS